MPEEDDVIRGISICVEVKSGERKESTCSQMLPLNLVHPLTALHEGYHHTRAGITFRNITIKARVKGDCVEAAHARLE